MKIIQLFVHTTCLIGFTSFHSSFIFCITVSSTVFGDNLINYQDKKITETKRQLWASVLYLPSSGGTIKFKFFFAWMGQIFFMVCRSSMSAWSCSSAVLIFMFRFSLIRANNVVVKWTCRETGDATVLVTWRSITGGSGVGTQLAPVLTLHRAEGGGTQHHSPICTSEVGAMMSDVNFFKGSNKVK